MYLSLESLKRDVSGCHWVFTMFCLKLFHNITFFYKEWICFRSFVRNGKFSYSPKNNSHIRWKANRFHRVDFWWLSFKWNGKSIYDKLILPNWFHNVPIIYFYSWGSMFVRRHEFPALFGRNFVSTCSVLGIILMNI